MEAVAINGLIAAKQHLSNLEANYRCWASYLNRVMSDPSNAHGKSFTYLYHAPFMRLRV